MHKASLKKYLRRLLEGRAELQPLFEALHQLSLVGMGYGSACSDSNSDRLVVRYLAQQVRNRVIPVVFDVGASIGHYTLDVLSVFGKDVTLYCFEPSSTAFAELSRKLKVHNNVKVYNYGLGEKNEMVTLYSPSPGSDFGSIYPRHLTHIGVDVEYAEDVKLICLDDFCQANGISHIHLLKLDAEGNELNILKGGKRLIQSFSIDLIQFELGRAHIDARVYFKDFFYFLNKNYQIHRASSNGFIRMNDYEEAFEIFKTTNYLALSRKYKDSQ